MTEKLEELYELAEKINNHDFGRSRLDEQTVSKFWLLVGNEIHDHIIEDARHKLALNQRNGKSTGMISTSSEAPLINLDRSSNHGEPALPQRYPY